jgi:glycogen debranching enzyme
MQEIIRLEDQFYILTTSPRVDDRACVLKHEDTFGVFDRYGDISPLGKGDQGIYHKGTRFLSTLGLTVCGQKPLLLGSTLNQNNLFLNSDMTNPDIKDPVQGLIPKGALHIFRSKFLWDAVCYDRIRISNFSTSPLRITVAIQFEADFVDLFEVRGNIRQQRGQALPVQLADQEVVLSYDGLDHVTRKTRVRFNPMPEATQNNKVQFSAELNPKEDVVFMSMLSCELSSATVPVLMSFDNTLHRAQASYEAAEKDQCQISTSNAQFNAWLQRSMVDLRSLISHTPHGAYPCAGIPWFCVPFGRDGIITALQTLWWDPRIAKGVLTYLAANQATTIDESRDAEPGKILHEAREGEMAALGEIPFGRYYGSVDSTPLFVILAAAYFQRTADRAFLQELWPNIRAALRWMDTHGDEDRDGFVEYFRRTPRGLQQQGWKDSPDSVFHSDGRIPEGPIALCEVQGYVYMAKIRSAVLARALGDEPYANQLKFEAERLQKRFETQFWSEELKTYILALDGEKKPCKVRSSNAGHCLFTGIASPEHAQRVCDVLLAETSFSGWGIRTIDASELRYNPMSYHNGSVWPHDNALIAAGFWRYGFRTEALEIINSLFDISQHVELNRLPELICGFRRRAEEGPTLYPTACSPQAWASGSALLVLQTFLGMTMDAEQQQIRFTRPILPSFVNEVAIHRLKIGNASLSIRVRGERDNVDVHIERERGTVEAVVYK